jgi:hypothetical protein
MSDWWDSVAEPELEEDEDQLVAYLNRLGQLERRSWWSTWRNVILCLVALVGIWVALWRA